MAEAPFPALIETPYSGDIEKNVEFAIRCMTALYKRNFAPVLTHLLWTRISTDNDGAHVADGVKEVKGREYALAAGNELAKTIGYVVFFTDLGWSSGMKTRLEFCEKLDIPLWSGTLNEFISALDQRLEHCLRVIPLNLAQADSNKGNDGYCNDCPYCAENAAALVDSTCPPDDSTADQ